MKTLKIFLFLFLFLLLSITEHEALAQIFRNDTTREGRQGTNNTTQGSWRDRVRLGGNFGVQFGNVTFIDISPLVLYQVTERAQIGVGATYQYIRFNFANLRNTTGNSIFGGRTFLRYFLFPGIFAQGEYEMLNTRYYDPLANEIRRAWIPAGFVGGGYSQQVGGRSALNVTILYNLLYEQYKSRSVYASPLVVRMGITL